MQSMECITNGENSEKEDLLVQIKKLHNTCLKLNSELICFFGLQNEFELKKYNEFELPIIASKQKIILSKGVIKCRCEDKPLAYHIHGTGITFVYDELKISFEYFPKTQPERKPILGLSGLFDFICSAYPKSQPTYDNIKNALEDLFQKEDITRLHDDYFVFYLNN